MQVTNDKVYGQSDIMNGIVDCFIENKCSKLFDFKEFNDLQSKVNDICNQLGIPGAKLKDLTFELDSVLSEMNSLIMHISYEFGFKEGMSFRQYVSHSKDRFFPIRNL